MQAVLMEIGEEAAAWEETLTAQWSEIDVKPHFRLLWMLLCHDHLARSISKGCESRSVTLVEGIWVLYLIAQ